MSKIQQFYADQNILITGATGFIGKALTEKLLRSCRDIRTIYILIRSKKGKSVEERLDVLINDTIFSVLRNDYPEFSKKIVAVEGDITEERLGLSVKDYTRLVNEVSVIFHVAATVRFTEKLEVALAINVNSVKSIINIAKECKNFKIGVYVSTAYSNCVRKSIREEVYPSPMSYEEVNQLIKNIKENNYSENTLKAFTGDWPNSYTFSKAIAEGIVAEFAKDLPFLIFRPSIVTSAYEEPTPGWVSGVTGLPGLMCAGAIGIEHVAMVDGSKRSDIVPVDYACNGLISATFETATSPKRHAGNVSVYNYISGNEQPITWEEFYDKACMYGRIYPSNKSIYYPWAILTKSRLLYAIMELFLHLLPALVIDNVARWTGRDLQMYKIALKLGEAWRAVGYFCKGQWDFENQNIQHLWKQLGPEDQKTFPFSMRNLDWDDYCYRMVRGLRKFIIAEPHENIEQAKRRHFYLFLIHVTLSLLFSTLVLWVSWKVFQGIAAQVLPDQQF